MPHQSSPRPCEHTTPRHPSVPNLLRGRQAGMTAYAELDNSARPARKPGLPQWRQHMGIHFSMGGARKYLQKTGGWEILCLTRHLIRKGAQPSIPKVEELPYFAELLVTSINQIPDRLIRQRHQLPVQHFFQEPRRRFVVHM